MKNTLEIQPGRWAQRLRLGSNLNLAMYKDGVDFDNGKIILQWDDAWGSVWDNREVFTSRGITANTFWVNGNLIGTTNANGFDYCTWDELKAARALGWDIQCHGYRGSMLDTLTDEQIAAEYTNNNSAFISNGISLPKHTCYSAIKYTDNALKIVDNYRLTGRAGTANNPLIDRKSSKFEMPTIVNSNAESTIKAYIDDAKRWNKAIILNGHMLGVDNALSISVEQIGIYLDYAKSVGLDFITISQLYNLMYYADIRVGREGLPDDQIDVVVNRHKGEPVILERSTDKENWTTVKSFAQDETDFSDTGLTVNTNYWYRAKISTRDDYSRIANVSTPVSLTLTATGDGSGVATLKMTTWDTMTVELTGGAKFYTDAAGTLGESTTCEFVRDEIKTIYIRNASGTSYMVFPSNKVSQIRSWTSATNAPSLGGDLSGWTYLNYIRMSGQNTITGDIGDLVNLTYLNIEGSNTLYGNLGNLYRIETVLITGSNEISGDITNLSKLAYIYVSGSNTVTGDITNNSVIYYIRVLGLSAVGGDISDKTKLIYLQGNVFSYFSGDIGGVGTDAVVNGITTLNLTACRFTTYTSGATWTNGTVVINPSTGYGYDVPTLTNILLDMYNSAVFSGKIIRLLGANSSLADTTQGGIWGDFSGSAEPSDLAVAVKDLATNNTMQLNGISFPEATGDGTGFPTGFGDWYRS